MSNETYVDLEKQHANEKLSAVQMRYIRQLVLSNPNDADLGAKIREFILKTYDKI